MKLVGFQFCNSTNELEPAAFTVVPELLPIGPLLASNRFGNSTGYFWPENFNCLKWLDQQPPNSAVYVAFGSHVALDHLQFQELEIGLELCNRPFLWALRPDLVNNGNDAYPGGFQDRAAIRGQIVDWAPQQKVLGHRTIASLWSRCGWNSTMESVSKGIRLLYWACWPYLFDQFLNERYVCAIWKVRLDFERNESRIIPIEKIKNKVDQVLGDVMKIKSKMFGNQGKSLEYCHRGWIL